MLQCLVSKLKSLLLGSLHLVSRLLCCLRRRRRSSDPVIPVSVDTSVSSTAARLVNEAAGATNWDNDDWDNCEVVIDKPRTTSDHQGCIFCWLLATEGRQQKICVWKV